MTPDAYDRVKALLDRWAERMSVGGMVSEGAPKQSVGAPDARIHTIEDMEIEVDKVMCRAVDTAVWELQVIERQAVMLYYGLTASHVWRAQFDVVFDMAIESLYNKLKARICC